MPRAWCQSIPRTSGACTTFETPARSFRLESNLSTQPSSAPPAAPRWRDVAPVPARTWTAEEVEVVDRHPGSMDKPDEEAVQE